MKSPTTLDYYWPAARQLKDADLAELIATLQVRSF